MKKHIFVLCIIILNSVTAFGQLEGFMGVKLGFSSANEFGADFTIDSKNRNNLKYGAFFNVIVNQNTSVLAELSNAPAGYKLVDKNSDYKVSNNYLMFSVRPHYYILDQRFLILTGPYLSGGFYTSYLLTSRLDGSVAGIEYDKIDVRDDFRKADFGLAAGCGFSIFGFLSLGFEYYYGLAKITDERVKNNCWSFSLYYGIPSDSEFGD